MWLQAEFRCQASRELIVCEYLWNLLLMEFTIDAITSVGNE